MMILVLDNYDSFTYNLAQYLGELGAEPVVRRNDKITVREVSSLEPAAVVVSPGPGIPSDAGISIDLIRWCMGRVPLLGVCLGHQALAEAVGGRVVRAECVMHGKASSVVHRGAGVFRGLPSPIVAMRYNSLLVEHASLPSTVRVTAWTETEGGSEVMGLEHQTHPMFGVQFHPESVGTASGMALIRNFLEIAAEWRRGVCPSRGTSSAPEIRP